MDLFDRVNVLGDEPVYVASSFFGGLPNVMDNVGLSRNESLGGFSVPISSNDDGKVLELVDFNSHLLEELVHLFLSVRVGNVRCIDIDEMERGAFGVNHSM